MSGHNNDQVQRLRKWLLALVIIIVFAAGAAPLVVVTVLESRVADAQFDITCTSAQANIEQLEALSEIAERLGIPHEFQVSQLPEECR